jgi:hypothetical protein
VRAHRAPVRRQRQRVARQVALPAAALLVGLHRPPALCRVLRQPRLQRLPAGKCGGRQGRGLCWTQATPTAPLLGGRSLSSPLCRARARGRAHLSAASRSSCAACSVESSSCRCASSSSCCLRSSSSARSRSAAAAGARVVNFLQGRRSNYPLAGEAGEVGGTHPPPPGAPPPPRVGAPPRSPPWSFSWAASPTAVLQVAKAAAAAQHASSRGRVGGRRRRAGKAGCMSGCWGKRLAAFRPGIGTV